MPAYRTTSFPRNAKKQQCHIVLEARYGEDHSASECLQIHQQGGSRIRQPCLRCNALELYIVAADLLLSREAQAQTHQDICTSRMASMCCSVMDHVLVLHVIILTNVHSLALVSFFCGHH